VTHQHPEAVEYDAAAEALAREADGIAVTPTRIHILAKGGPVPFDAFIVKGTDGLLAIDERVKPRGMEPGRWFITHVPTGFRMDVFRDWHCSTRDGAAVRARRFFDEWNALGFTLDTEDASEIVAQFARLSTEARLSLRRRVAQP
jgi:hypothetical protein